MKSMLLFLFVSFTVVATQAQNFADAEQIMLNNQKLLGDEQVLIIYKDGKIMHQKMLGNFRPNLQAPVGESSQWFTAALVMIMVQEGKLSLDDNVGKYLPIFPKWMKGYITIRHCLSHTTGIETDKQGAGKLFQRKSFATLEEEVNYYAEKRAIANNPGIWFQYDQIGPSIAGRVLEVITKKKFDRLAQEKLFRPLNMRITSFSNYTSAISPFDGAKSSAFEYTNFLSMLLNKGMFNGKQILTEESIAELMKLQTGEALNKYTPPFMNGFSYGLGTWRETTDGKVVNCVSQNSPFVWIDYCRGYACILLSKKERSGLKRELYDQLKTAVNAQLKSSCN
jgi:CubicO group peptidase (beta-lactamase class C family)